MTRTRLIATSPKTPRTRWNGEVVGPDIIDGEAVSDPTAEYLAGHPAIESKPAE